LNNYGLKAAVDFYCIKVMRPALRVKNEDNEFIVKVFNSFLFQKG